MRRHSDDLMIGPGGRGRIPKSETAQIDRAWDRLENMRFNDLSEHNRKMVAEAMAILKALHIQVSQGYHRNPSESRLHVPFRIVDVLGKAVHEIAYKHKNGKLYKHDFDGSDAQVLAVIRNGKRELLISSVDGSPLWDEF